MIFRIYFNYSVKNFMSSYLKFIKAKNQEQRIVKLDGDIKMAALFYCYCDINTLNFNLVFVCVKFQLY